MDSYLFFVSISAIVGLGLVIWSFTKPGKKWLDSLK